MSCVSSSLCVARAASRGEIVTTTDPTDAATAKWTIKGILPENHTIVGMSCPSSSLCVGVDDQGDTVTSTDPGDGPSASWRRRRPGSTPTNHVTNPFTSVSCPSTSLCVAVDEDGNVLSTTDPTDGSAAVWATVQNADPSSSRLHQRCVVCFGVVLCRGRRPRGTGNILASTDPGDGASATWTRTDADGSTRLNAIYCFPRRASCIAGDQTRATRWTSTDPGS